MPKFRGSLLSLFVVAAVALSLSAADKESKKEERKKKRQGQAAERLFQLPASIELTAEQQEKVDKLKNEYTPKLAEAQKKINAIVTADQRKAQQEAVKEARQSGKKNREAEEAGMAALKLSGEDRPKYEEARREMQQLQNQARAEIRALLTPEQQAELPRKGKGKGKKKNNN